MTRVLVTGATGFVGTALTVALRASGHDVRATSRRSGPNFLVTAPLSANTDWSAALDGVEAVVHLAGPAHKNLPEAEIQRAIADGAATLAEQAERAGVRRFIFISSIKATAARTAGTPARESDPPRPEDAYGRAKLAAERAVLARAAIAPVVLRPPLVHAADAKANFALLLGMAQAPIPVPLEGVGNRRSLISRDALIGAVRAVLARSDGPAGVFHVAEQPAVSSAEMIAALRHGLGRAPDLLSVALAEIALPASLRESLEVDDSKFRAAYGYDGADLGTHASLAATAAARKAGA
jgi:nucleoside-diphosphate-sugar epimerase